MKKEILHNKINRNILIKELKKETFNRITCSFYKYIDIENPIGLRDRLYISWSNFNIFGRIYVSKEGINAQLSCPEHNWNKFKMNLNDLNILKNIQIKKAVVEGNSFYKLTIKVRDEIVAYGLKDNDYDINKTGKHINSRDFNT